MKICDDLHEVLIEAGYSNCLLYPYGSTINSVGCTNSDLDLYVDLQLSQDTTLKIAKILENCSQFVDIKAVPNARVPIVKAVHFLSGIKCDISFGNKASLWNTEFIRFCCLRDPRVRPLIMLVRYWGRMQGLVRRDGQVRLCNYALTLMVIAYLQQIPCPILHSVQQLVTIMDVDIHPFSFCSLLMTKQDKLPLLLKNTDSLTDLLMGFFNHYKSFDYENNVISLFLGRTLNKQATYVNMCKSYKPVCVQDPFEVNFNVCRNITESGLTILKCRSFEAVGKIYQMKRNPNLLSTLFQSSLHSSPVAGCYGCGESEYYQPSLQEYQAAAMMQRMPPWWRRWRRLS